jgi:hypothetical protein
MNKIIKIIIGGFIILTMYLLLLKPSAKCSNDKPYLENGKCVASCASGKRDYKKCLSATENCPPERSNINDGVCLSSCPSGKVNDNGVCLSSCPSGKVNDNGVCLSSCPSGKVNDNGVCLASCPSGKVNDNGVCLSSCPTIRPVVINGVCNPCPSGQVNDNGVCLSSCPSGKVNDNGVCVSSCPSGKVNDNGVCLSSCPTIRPVVINGVCNPCTSQVNDDGTCRNFMGSNYVGPHLGTPGFVSAIDGDYNSVYTPNVTNSSMVWFVFRWYTPVNVNGILLKFAVDNATTLSPLILKLYKNVDNTVQPGVDLSTREFPSSDLIYTREYTSIPNPNVITIQQKLNQINVSSILVLFTRRVNIYDIQFY